jgi:hypothetical protein
VRILRSRRGFNGIGIGLKLLMQKTVNVSRDVFEGAP